MFSNQRMLSDCSRWKEGVWPACGPTLFWPHPAHHDSLLNPPTVWLSNVPMDTLVLLPSSFPREVSEHLVPRDSEVKTHKFDLTYVGRKCLFSFLSRYRPWRSQAAKAGKWKCFCTFRYSYVQPACFGILTLPWKGKALSHFKMTLVDLIHWKWWEKAY